jgi:hypothetical protein
MRAAWRVRVVFLLLQSAWRDQVPETACEKLTATRAALARERLPNASVIKNIGPIGRPAMERGRHGCRARSLLRDRANVRRTAVLFQLRIHDRFPPHPRHCALSSYVAMGQLCCWMVKNVAVAHCTRCSTDNRGSNSPSVLVRAHSRRVFFTSAARRAHHCSLLTLSPVMAFG